MTKVIDINTRKTKTLRGNNKANARKWEVFMDWVDSGLLTITIAGTVLNKEEVTAFAETLDDQVKKEDDAKKKQKIKEKVKRHRSRKKDGAD